MNRDEKIFRKFLGNRGLTPDKSALAVFQAVQKMSSHFSAEEVLDSLHESSARVGIATVWRALRLIQQAGLVEEHYFGKAGLRYEMKTAPAGHGHIVCNDCGHTAEFDVSKFLPLIHDTMKHRDFRLEGYELSLFGSCSECSCDKSENSKDCIERIDRD